MSDLKKQAEELGIQVDGRWSDSKIQAMIDEKLAADPEPEVAEDPASETLAEGDEEAADEPEADPVEPDSEEQVEATQSVTIKNLQANPMKSLGLASYGEVTLTELQMADPAVAARVKRAVELGLIQVK